MTFGRQAYVDSIRAGRGRPDETARATVDRAVGLLAGRAGCRLAEAHRHLLLMATEQDRDVVEVAAGMIHLLDVPALITDRGPPELLVAPPPVAFDSPVHRSEPWLTMVQGVLDAVPGSVALFRAEYDDQGRLTDLVCAAATPEAVAPGGRHGEQILGIRMAAQFSQGPPPERWLTYEEVLATGVPAELKPFRFGDTRYSVRAQRLGEALLLSWTWYEQPAGVSGRIARTELLGNLGWGEWDLVTGESSWSDQLYRIYERDPGLGPPSPDEIGSLTLPEDRPLRQEAMRAFERGERVDVISRVRINGRIKHLRTVVDALRDTGGRPLRIYGITQDVTARETDAARLAEVELQLVEQRRNLAAEHALAARLQQIILPLPEGPIELPGLKVALRYLPAVDGSLVGGDWYHAAELRDGSVLLAVGDVTGHGIVAATTMAQLRHALRALAVTTSDPAVLLGHLNRLTCDLDREIPETAATAVVARYEPHRRRVTWAQAGHPPPLLSRGGRTAPLARPSGPMLGVVDDASYATFSLDLHIGDVLLLYTDGLIEHRRRSMEVGMNTVIAAVDEAVAASPERPLVELLNRLRRANPDDDTCILACRPVTGETQDLRRHLKT